MGKVIAEMNFNYYKQESSDLAQVILEIYKVSLKNGTYPKMIDVFEREIPTSKCFSDSKHNDLDNLVTFHNTVKKMVSNEIVNSDEEIHARVM